MLRNPYRCGEGLRPRHMGALDSAFAALVLVGSGVTGLWIVRSGNGSPSSRALQGFWRSRIEGDITAGLVELEDLCRYA
jgi:hypothetical protein